MPTRIALLVVLLIASSAAAGEPSSLTIPAAHDGWVTSVAYSPGRAYIASGGEDNVLKIWYATSGKELSTLQRHTDNVTAVVFSPDGKRIVSASRGVLKVWAAP